jgi:hypothetical protein
VELLGFDYLINRRDEPVLKSVSADVNDGSAVVTVGSMDTTFVTTGVGDAVSHTMSFDVDPSIVSEQQLITKYREIALLPEVEKAVDIIINEMISSDNNELVTIDLDNLDYGDSLKKTISEEFDVVLGLMDFNHNGWNILKRWYVDGRWHYQVIIDQKQYAKQGIGKLQYIDPRKIKKVRVLKAEKDPRTGVDLYQEGDEFYLYSENGFHTDALTFNTSGSLPTNNEGTKLSKESVVQATSGLLNPSNTVILSYLHKAIRPLNQLRGLEDATLIYRISRAPERRVFYIDVGNLPVGKQEQHLRRQMQQYRNKVVYDSASGTIKSDSKQLTMLEDFWLPRTGDGKATQIDTLPGGQNLGQMEEVTFFLNKLYNSLNVPITRLDPSTGFSIGRSTEITRDEVFFIKFIERLRNQFSSILLDLLRRQLALKGIMNPDEFDRVRNKISFEWKADNHWAELLENEIFSARLDLLDRVNTYKGQYWSMEYIKRNVLKQSQELIDEIAEEIEAEKDAGVYDEAENLALAGDDPDVMRVIGNDASKPKPQAAGKPTSGPTTPTVTAAQSNSK